MKTLKLGEGVVATHDKENGDIIVTIRDWSNDPPRPLYERDRFWVDGREFNRDAPGSLLWKSADGWHFWQAAIGPTASGQTVHGQLGPVFVDPCATEDRKRKLLCQLLLAVSSLADALRYLKEAVE